MSRVAIIISLAVLCTLGCMDPLEDYQECVEIETARCSLREKCSSSFDFDTCVAYAREHCRTRQIPNDCNGSNNLQPCVNACVDAIEQVDCDLLEMSYNETENLEECEFLDPPDEEPDAGSDTDTDTDTYQDAG